MRLEVMSVIYQKKHKESNPACARNPPYLQCTCTTYPLIDIRDSIIAKVCGSRDPALVIPWHSFIHCYTHSFGGVGQARAQSVYLHEHECGPAFVVLKLNCVKDTLLHASFGFRPRPSSFFVRTAHLDSSYRTRIEALLHKEYCADDFSGARQIHGFCEDPHGLCHDCAPTGRLQLFTRTKGREAN
ncbi:hypothetical protein BDZ94DRAFT_892997 [Collybia nuda]|uniref:Uncharacterized protein n=1 Tax=Collybia nuda TaxID=64659 RepID=A0A9P5Y310_9AGAR|nr:hypothetical protein BDZ94DRAFT_892997 [Collybia nuda]